MILSSNDTILPSSNFKVEPMEPDVALIDQNRNPDFEFNFNGVNKGPGETFETNSENDVRSINKKFKVKDHFEFTPTKEHRKCKDCPQVYSTNTSGTVLNKHLRVVHPNIYNARFSENKMCDTKKLTAHNILITSPSFNDTVPQCRSIKVEQNPEDQNGNPDFEFNLNGVIMDHGDTIDTDSQKIDVGIKKRIIVKDHYEYTPTRQHRKCKGCPQIYSTKTSATTLKRHLRVVHPDYIKNGKIPEYNSLCGMGKQTVDTFHLIMTPSSNDSVPSSKFLKVQPIDQNTEIINLGNSNFEINSNGVNMGHGDSFETDSENDVRRINKRVTVKDQFEYTPTKQHRKCKRCLQIYSTNTSETTLKRHLRVAHPDYILNAKIPEYKTLSGVRKLTADENFHVNKMILDMLETNHLRIDLIKSKSFKSTFYYLNKNIEIWDKQKAIKYVSTNQHHYPTLLAGLSLEESPAKPTGAPTITDLVNLSKRNKRS